VQKYLKAIPPPDGGGIAFKYGSIGGQWPPIEPYLKLNRHLVLVI